jgi:hypothetical protein
MTIYGDPQPYREPRITWYSAVLLVIFVGATVFLALMAYYRPWADTAPEPVAVEKTVNTDSGPEATVDQVAPEEEGSTEPR